GDLYPIAAASAASPAIAASVRDRLQKPLAFLTHASATTSEAQAATLRRLGIPVLLGTETGLRAVRHAVEHARFQRERKERAPVAAARRAGDRGLLRREVAPAGGGAAAPAPGTR